MCQPMFPVLGGLATWGCHIVSGSSGMTCKNVTRVCRVTFWALSFCLPSAASSLGSNWGKGLAYKQCSFSTTHPRHHFLHVLVIIYYDLYWCFSNFSLVQPCSLSLSLCDLMCFRFFSGHVSGAVTKTQQVAAMHSRTLGPLLAVQLRQFWFCSARSATHGSRCACGTWGRPHARPEYSAKAHNWSTIDINWSTRLRFCNVLPWFFCFFSNRAAKKLSPSAYVSQLKSQRRLSWCRLHLPISLASECLGGLAVLTRIPVRCVFRS